MQVREWKKKTRSYVYNIDQWWIETLKLQYLKDPIDIIEIK